VSRVLQHVISLDRQSYWDGMRWVRAARISRDGKWFSDGSNWLPVPATTRSFWWPLNPPQWASLLWWGVFAWVLPIVLFGIVWGVYFATHHHF